MADTAVATSERIPQSCQHPGNKTFTVNISEPHPGNIPQYRTRVVSFVKPRFLCWFGVCELQDPLNVLIAGTVDHGPLLSQAVVHTRQRGEQEGFS
ncbi:hypothetical protein F2P79_018170 [Pimephales promelas]|nr:hypothetical protein F2P79_018170 [Pimephales promelas]